MRPIDADALVVHLYKEIEACIAMEDYVPEQFKEYYRGKMEAFIEVAAHVKRHTPTLDYVPKQQWISVKDKLPKCEPPFCENVIVCTISGKVMPGFCNRGDWYAMIEEEDFCDSVGFDRVTHWMPLPEAPKEEE